MGRASRKKGVVLNFKKTFEGLELKEDEYIELVKLFFETSMSDIINLLSAINSNNTEKVSMIAHSLKGAAVNLGLEEFLELAKIIEETARDGQLEKTAETAYIFQNKLDGIADIINS